MHTFWYKCKKQKISINKQESNSYQSFVYHHLNLHYVTSNEQKCDSLENQM